MGWSHRRLAICAYACMLLSSLIALWGLSAGERGAHVVLTALAAAYVAIGIMIDMRWKARAHT